jgi:hypothetical protein
VAGNELVIVSRTQVGLPRSPATGEPFTMTATPLRTVAPTTGILGPLDATRSTRRTKSRELSHSA